MITNDVTLRAIAGDVFRFKVFAHGNLPGLSISGDITDGETVIKHLSVESGISVGTYNTGTGITPITVTVGATTTANWTFTKARFKVGVIPTNPDEAYLISRGWILLDPELT